MDVLGLSLDIQSNIISPTVHSYPLVLYTDVLGLSSDIHSNTISPTVQSYPLVLYGCPRTVLGHPFNTTSPTVQSYPLVLYMDVLGLSLDIQSNTISPTVQSYPLVLYGCPRTVLGHPFQYYLSHSPVLSTGPIWMS